MNVPIVFFFFFLANATLFTKAVETEDNFWSTAHFFGRRR